MENNYIHILADFYGCQLSNLSSEAIVSALNEFSKMNKLNVLKVAYHEFQPQGVTCIFLLSESHLTLHTWPENSTVAFDCFSCNGLPELEHGLELVQRCLGAKRMKLTKYNRVV